MKNMSTYLYTWNPTRWPWCDFGEAICRVNEEKIYEIPWSCGNTKKIAVGDQFFMMKLGEEPKGVIGYGYISSKPYEGPHWNIEEAEVGKKTLRTLLSFVLLSDTPLVEYSKLNKMFPGYNWTPQTGGLTISEEISDDLRSYLEINEKREVFRDLRKENSLFVEGKLRLLTVKTYDRSVNARQACITHYGYECTICGFSFKRKYGDIGSTYIEVHHLNPISEKVEEYLIDPIKDLRPVCANCHRMLHRKQPPYSISELEQKIKSLRSEQ